VHVHCWQLWFQHFHLIGLFECLTISHMAQMQIFSCLQQFMACLLDALVVMAFVSYLLLIGTVQALLVVLAVVALVIIVLDVLLAGSWASAFLLTWLKTYLHFRLLLERGWCGAFLCARSNVLAGQKWCASWLCRSLRLEQFGFKDSWFNGWWGWLIGGRYVAW